MEIHSHEDFRRNYLLAVDPLAERLREGNLCLFLGAGVSSGFGLPEWVRLISDVLGRSGDENFVEGLRHRSRAELGKLVDSIDRETGALARLVHVALYKEVEDDLAAQLARSPLLLAVAALVSGSCRGRIQSVITFNYDDLLEQYLAMLGQRVCVRQNPYDLSFHADVEINHVHGYLPQHGCSVDNCRNLVLSERSYRERRSEIDEGWSAAVLHALQNRLGLFLGLSGDDGSIKDVLQRANSRIRRGHSYRGYWILSPGAYERNSAELVEIGMCPIPIDPCRLPQFLFAVCRGAVVKGC